MPFFRVYGDTNGGYTSLCDGICQFLLLTWVITDIRVNGENEVLLMAAAFKHGGVIFESGFFQQVKTLPGIHDPEVCVGIKAANKFVALMQHV